MLIKLKNLTVDGKTYNGALRGVHFDCGTGTWKATVTWRTRGVFKKADAAGADMNALVTSAIEVLAPPTPAV